MSELVDVTPACFPDASGRTFIVKLVADQHVKHVTEKEKVYDEDTEEVLGHINVLATLYCEDGVIVGPGGVVLSM